MRADFMEHKNTSNSNRVKKPPSSERQLVRKHAVAEAPATIDIVHTATYAT